MNVFRAGTIEIVFPDVNPAIRNIKIIGKNCLVDNDAIAPAGVLNSIDRTFASGVHGRDADIHCIHARG